MSRRQRREAWLASRQDLEGSQKHCEIAMMQAYAPLMGMLAGGANLTDADHFCSEAIPEHLRLPRNPGQGTHAKRSTEWRKGWAKLREHGPGIWQLGKDDKGIPFGRWVAT